MTTATTALHRLNLTMTQMKKETPDVQAIKALIQKFFDAINDADTKALGTNFESPDATLTIVKQDPPLNPSSSNYPQYTSIPTPPAATSSSSTEEKSVKVVIRTTIERFIALLDAGKKRREGQPDLNIKETPDLEATDVRVDALFGMAWSPFKVTFDGVLHHYGTIVYTVVKKEGEWKIEGLTQNYRRTEGWEGESEFM